MESSLYGLEFEANPQIVELIDRKMIGALSPVGHSDLSSGQMSNGI